MRIYIPDFSNVNLLQSPTHLQKSPISLQKSPVKSKVISDLRHVDLALRHVCVCVCIRMHSVGVNFHDTYTRSGLYPQRALPVTNGCEGAGVIIEVA